jgi:hypothetical protein
MAVSKKNPKRNEIGGPFLAAAVFCESIIESADGALSAIRIVDQFNVILPSNTPDDVPSESNRIAISIWLLLMLRSGSARGKREISCTISSPSGKTAPLTKQKLDIGEKLNGGVNMRIQLNISIEVEGLYIVDVFVDGKVITRMPLLINIARDEATPQKTSAKRRNTNREK